MARHARLPDWQISEACCRALRGYPYNVVACIGYIESDYAPGTFYPCETCNPGWCRVAEPSAALAATETR